MVVFDCHKLPMGTRLKVRVGDGNRGWGRGWSDLGYWVGSREVVGLVKVFGLEI